MTVIQIVSSLAFLSISVVSGNSNDPARAELNWKKHYDSAKQMAQAAERPLVVVLENPANETEKIDETNLREQDRKTISKENFALVRVDVNTDYGKRVAAAFGATRFPYTAVTDDRSVRIVFRKAGQMSEKDWTLALAKSSETKEVDPITVEPNKVVTDKSKQDAFAAGIRWEMDVDRARDMMKEEQRPMFLYFTAPGCTYCEIMKAEAFANSRIAAEIGSAFVPVQVDGRQHKDLSDRFQVRMFPTIAIIHHSGEVMELWSGYNGMADFETHLSIARSRLANRP